MCICGTVVELLGRAERCRVGAKDYSSAPLTEPDMRATRPALWMIRSEGQYKLF